ncbi:CopD family protein [Ktedonospora formicarum]|uniref:Copper resistance protein D domain-containing protein n=1 Tax=Ktedonospora formicarum TaxID=2778364 RepID=A0A8J3MPD5_9CHLR|nr:CopD family protein [Ktedonospora formicarum]GHO43707.1 hypothetical protein KSX_18700 [Ktedonospora formicarum]
MLVHLIMRAAHTLAGAAWVGGSIMYLLVVMPALRAGGPAPLISSQVASLFKRMVNACMGIMVLTGAYLTVDRLTQTTLGWAYLATLIAKVVLVIAMLITAIYLGQSNIRRLAKQTTRFSKLAPQLMLALGILVFILGALLNILYENTIALH